MANHLPASVRMCGYYVMAGELKYLLNILMKYGEDYEKDVVFEKDIIIRHVCWALHLTLQDKIVFYQHSVDTSYGNVSLYNNKQISLDSCMQIIKCLVSRGIYTLDDISKIVTYPSETFTYIWEQFIIPEPELEDMVKPCG